jgi:DNA helicase HerA-like ATPase
MPEVGDIDKPKLVFFFDEAHLLFNSAPKPLLEKIEQLVRLIRSKGIGVYFVTQTPLDVPASVLGQLGNRVQHALRGFTPADQKAIRAAAQTFRKNPHLDTEKVISEMGVGEALVSFLDNAGKPSIVERIKIAPPESRIGAISAEERNNIIKASSYFGQYKKTIDRESAYEVLTKKMEEKQPATEKSETPSPQKAKRGPGRPRQSPAEAMITSAARSFGNQIGRQIIRGVMGSIFKK